MIDERITKLAKNLVNYSCKLQKGEKILIEAKNVDYMLVNAIVKEVFSVGGYPFVEMLDNRVSRQLLLGETEEYAKLRAKYDGYRMADMDAYIGIYGGNNYFENSDIPQNVKDIDLEHYEKYVHHQLRVKHTKWVVLRYPTEGMAQLSNMSTDAYEDFYFKVCNLDYAKINLAMNNLKKRLDEANDVRIVAPNTDLSFSIKGMKSIKCSGEINIPDGEVYTAPVKDSVNGTIAYNTPSIKDGVRFDNVALTFKDGKIIKATGSNQEEINAIFDTDDGAKYVGEFAFGVNPYITKPMGSILFDEKIAGSIHFTPGNSYADCFNGNKSKLHWDLVLILTPEYGGGEIYFDGELISKDGKFVTPDLLCLNPENLI